MQDKRVLIVEDEPLVALFLAQFFRGLGVCIVGPAMRLDTALKFAQHEPLDGAVLDVRLGGGTTSEPVACCLKERGIPFVFLTGTPAEVQMMGMGGYPVVTKPTDGETLAVTLKQTLTPL